MLRSLDAAEHISAAGPITAITVELQQAGIVDAQKSWFERWTINSAGVQRQYTIGYVTGAGGGTDFQISK
ncbi:MAG: hypothetical protein HYZ92_02175 [Candidatus Omnitrophica bacterium]|nr:hypothetical protein [Candidatus Omnitrophota bacterium]